MTRFQRLCFACVLVSSTTTPMLWAQAAVAAWWQGDTSVAAPLGVKQPVAEASALPEPAKVHPVPESGLRAAIVADMAQTKVHPKDAQPHIRLAYELLDAGAGTQAQAEALAATKLAPKSVEAFRALGWTLEFNAISVRLGRGFDWKGSIAAWQQAKDLKDADAAVQLAALGRYDANGFPPSSAEPNGDTIAGAKPELPPSAPIALVEQFLIAEMQGKLDEAMLGRSLARHAYGNDALWEAAVKRNLVAAGQLLLLWRRSGMPLSIDYLAMANTKLTTTGDDTVAFVTRNGNAAETFLVVREDGQFRIVGGPRNDAEAGAEALYFLHQGNEAAARAILNWKLTQTRGGRGGARVETSVGPSADGVLLAAAGLLVGRSDIGPLLPQIAAIRDKEPAEEQGSLDMLLARGYLYVGDGAHATAVTRRLRAAHPGDEAIENLCAQADALTQDFADWKAILAAQLARRPGNRSLIEAEAKEAETEGNFAQARADLKQIIAAGNAPVTDPNLYGWLALFSSPIAEDALPSALKANEMSNYTNFSAIHTLACLYAVTGRPAEARKTIMHGMEINNLAEPNDAVWMVMGYIYEDYGIRDAAILAYRNVVRPDKVPDVTESYILAQRRLKALGVD